MTTPDGAAMDLQSYKNLSERDRMALAAQALSAVAATQVQADTLVSARHADAVEQDQAPRRSRKRPKAKKPAHRRLVLDSKKIAKDFLRPTGQRPIKRTLPAPTLPEIAQMVTRDVLDELERQGVTLSSGKR